MRGEAANERRSALIKTSFLLLSIRGACKTFFFNSEEKLGMDDTVPLLLLLFFKMKTATKEAKMTSSIRESYQKICLCGFFHTKVAHH